MSLMLCTENKYSNAWTKTKTRRFSIFWKSRDSKNLKAYEAACQRELENDKDNCDPIIFVRRVKLLSGSRDTELE